MVFSSINVVPYQFFHKDPRKKFYYDAMQPCIKKKFEQLITICGIANDGFERKYVTIFTFSKPPIDSGNLPPLSIDKVTLYESNPYKIYSSRTSDFIDHVTADFAIVDSSSPTYRRFSIPKKVQNVFIALLKFIKIIKTQERHVRICIHNEKMFFDCGDGKPLPYFTTFRNMGNRLFDYESNHFGDNDAYDPTYVCGLAGLAGYASDCEY